MSTCGRGSEPNAANLKIKLCNNIEFIAHPALRSHARLAWATVLRACGA